MSGVGIFLTSAAPETKKNPDNAWLGLKLCYNILMKYTPAYKVIVGDVHKVSKTPFSTDPVFIGTFQACGVYVGQSPRYSIMKAKGLVLDQQRQLTERTV